MTTARRQSIVRGHRVADLRPRVTALMVVIFLIEMSALMLVELLAWQVRNSLVPQLAVPPTGIIGSPFLSSSGQVVLVAVVWQACLLASGAYSAKRFAVGYGDFPALARASVLAIGLVGFVSFILRLSLSRGFLLLTLVVGVPALLLVRYGERRAVAFMRSHGRLRHRAIVVGSVRALPELIAVLRRESWTGYDVVGICLPEAEKADSLGDVPVLGAVGEVSSVIRDVSADTVIVTGGSYTSGRDLRRIGWQLEGLDVELLVAPSLTDIAGPRIHMRNVAGLPLMHVEEAQLLRARGPLKAFFDRATAAALLMVSAPVFAAVAVLIKLHDGGPVFFRQRRVGVMGRSFDMIKFRSMVVDAEERQAVLERDSDGNGVLFKMRQDPRVTPIGRLIRRLSIDELPQLVNVIRGHMSLVGPRPALPYEVEKYGDDVRRRLLVRPGVTGLWQVSGRSDLSWEDSVRLDLYYVDNWSLVGDLVILLKTLRAVLVSRGAY